MLGNLQEEVDLLNRHLEILDQVIDNEPIGIVRLSNNTGNAHHEVRYSLRILEDDELIEATGQGAITTETTDEFVDNADKQIDEIINRLMNMKAESETPGVESKAPSA